MVTYEATPKMKEAKFRGQRDLVVKALSEFRGPKSLEEVAARVKKNGGYSYNEWTQKHGGLTFSVRYHLRNLVALGMVKAKEVAEPEPAAKAEKKGQAA